ncbi:sphingomyelin phosphodiesterase [Pseudoalteromonas luteoviolacea]|uniref:Phospholipase n=1 Tax=Pseudoalteromonas luteoviolacea H33 TaxID=1365251 RepID=A0A167DN27_9GAMM|nr:sphingomyelin phosphodiesterase [Pseudoalteromonas luteoviolacea]KZN49079.1 phospholipase [Pseudoalteromonas luteoviolacea H33]KZN75486.1 phospholipase [Pseudoalteromonas luteoviolacea H33-S]
MKVKLTLFCVLILLSTQSMAQSLKVMAYNIMQLNVQDWDQSNRAERLPAVIKSLSDSPDVILVNEVFNGDAEQALSALSDIYPYQTPNVGQDCSGSGWDSLTGNCSNSPFVIRGGVVIISKYPIVSQKAHVFKNSLSGSWDYLANKGFAYVEIEKNGQRYHLVGTHLQATHDGNTEQEHRVRMGQLGEIQTFIKAEKIPASEPVIIGGDMNVEWSKQHEIADMLTTSRSKLNFETPEVGSFSAKHNWFTKANAYYFDYSLEYNDTLDYVFWHKDYKQPKNNPSMSVRYPKAERNFYWSYLKGNWNLSSGRYYHNGYYNELSDHYPVQVNFEF